jgi:hypothetical protein
MFQKVYHVAHMIENVNGETYDAVTYRTTTLTLWGIPIFRKIREVSRERKNRIEQA